MLQNVGFFFLGGGGGCSEWEHGFAKIVWIDNLVPALTENIYYQLYQGMSSYCFVFIFKSSVCSLNNKLLYKLLERERQRFFFY